jgi:hypothetical protein
MKKNKIKFIIRINKYYSYYFTIKATNRPVICYLFKIIIIRLFHPRLTYSFNNQLLDNSTAFKISSIQHQLHGSVGSRLTHRQFTSATIASSRRQTFHRQDHLTEFLKYL